MFLRSSALNQDFRLSEGSTIIGRRGNCDIVLKSDSVSKEHLELEVDGTLVRARDLESRNNSTVNGRLIKGEGWIELHADDFIDICGIDFRFLRERGVNSPSGACIVETGATGSSLTGAGSRSIALSKSELAGGTQYSQLRALLAITTTLRDVLRTEDVLQRAVAMLFQIFPTIDRAAIGFIEGDREFTPKWWHVRTGDPDQVIRISDTIVRHVADTSRAVITGDAMADYGDAISVCALSLRSVMSAPLIDNEEQVIGIIHVDSIRRNMFTELDLEVLAAVAMQIGLAINFSRLHAIAVEDAILRQDVEKAREVQQRYIPDAPPPIAGCDLAGFYRAARHVGGDYFDYVPLEDGRIAIALGDVVGKGVPAALTMVRLATETRTSFEVCRTAREVVTRLNQKFVDDFITLVVLIIDPKSKIITISNAGHEPPLLRKADGTVDSIGFDASGCPLGVMEDYEYEESTIQLEPGESLVAFTDGFPDAEHEASGNRFGTDQVIQTLSEFDGAANDFIERVVGEVDRFVGDSSQFDDMCIVCLRRTE